jgi:CheY-like chemotaxis protein
MQRILIIDDEPMVLSLLGECLEAYGYETLVAVDPATGLKMAREREVHLILCDAKMPGMNGYDLAENLKTSSTHGHIPIIIMSGAPDEHREHSFADYFLAKPFFLPEVMELVSAWMSRQSAIPGAPAAA